MRLLSMYKLIRLVKNIPLYWFKLEKISLESKFITIQEDACNTVSLTLNFFTPKNSL